MDSKQFKQHRLDLKLTQQQLADKLGYNQASISRAEKVRGSLKLTKAFILLIESSKIKNWRAITKENKKEQNDN